MKTPDRYLSFVQWSKADAAYVGYCPDLFPAGGVCHAPNPIDAYRRLLKIVEDTVVTAKANKLKLPPPRTRPMREVEVTS